MMQFIKTILFRILIALLFIMGLVSFFINTTPGLYTVIKITSLFLPGTLQIKHLQGRLFDQFSMDEIIYNQGNTVLHIHQVKFKWQLGSVFHKPLQINDISAFKVQLFLGKGPDSSAFKLNELFNIRSSLPMNINHLMINQLSLNTVGTRYTVKHIEMSGEFKKEFFKINRFDFSSSNLQFKTNARLTTSPVQTLSGVIQVLGHAKTANAIKGSIRFGGDINSVKWDGELSGPGRISLDGNFSQSGQLVQTIQWSHLNWAIDKGKSIVSPTGTLQIKGQLPLFSLDITSRIKTYNNRVWQVIGSISGKLPWQWTLNIKAFDPSNKSKQNGLHTLISAMGELKDEHHGHLQVKIHPGYYQMAKNNALHSIPFKGGTIDAALHPDQFSGQGIIALNDNAKINLSFHLPQFKIKQGFSDTQSFSGLLSITLNNLKFLEDFSPEIKKTTGNLMASIKAQGTLKKTMLESELNLRNLSFFIPKLGLHFSSIDLKATGKEQKWHANGTIVSENNQLTIQGEGPLSNEWSGELNLQGANFPIIKTKEYDIRISPQLKLNFSSTELGILGTIAVPYAHITPQIFTNSVTLTDDIVYQNEEKTQPSSYNTRMDIRVDLGKDVQLTFKGLDALLGGSVRINQIPQGPINANGELTVIKGEYKAYGQDLAIEQGQLLFTGGRLSNPGINLRASKTIENSSLNFSGSNQIFDFKNNNVQNLNIGSHIKVGVEVTGQLTAPKVQLFSNPSILSQADTLSMLVLGRPASQANKSGGQLLLAAISSMNLGTGTNGAQLIEQLKRSLGFDFNIQTTNNYNQSTNQFTESTGFVVGKSISNRLYLSYNVGLSQADPNVLTLKYILNKFFSLQVSSSTIASGIDFLYNSNKTNRI